MKEITIFGRGGQGAVVASEILADAYFREGYHVQSFPSFGVERRGAPVTAFLRIDKEFIFLRTMIYQADAAIVLARDISGSPFFKSSLKKGARILINSAKEHTELDGFEVSYVDAAAIALEFGLGTETQPLVNTAVLGAFAAISGDLKLENLLEAVKRSVPVKAEENMKAVRKAFEKVV